MHTKNANIKVSVIMSVYNDASTVARAIDSILNQMIDGVEIIAVDDGSEDNSYEIMSEYSKKYDNVSSYRIEHGGQGAARNFGLDKARGEFVGFVDSDDAVSENMYQVLTERIGDADMCQCNSWIVLSNLEHKEELRHFEGEIVVTDRPKYIAEMFNTYIHSHGCCNKLIRKSFIDEYNIRFGDNKTVHAEDLYFNIMAIRHLKKIVFVDQMLYYYYQYPQSHSRSYSMEKVKRYCQLFDMVTDDECKYILAKLGVTDICINLTEFECDYNEILRRDDFQRLLRLAARSQSAMYQRLIYVSLMVLRGAPAHSIIKSYYGRFQRERTAGKIGG